MDIEPRSIRTQRPNPGPRILKVDMVGGGSLEEEPRGSKMREEKEGCFIVSRCSEL